VISRRKRASALPDPPAAHNNPAAKGEIDVLNQAGYASLAIMQGISFKGTVLAGFSRALVAPASRANDRDPMASTPCVR
jgi:hypothetical protein